MKPALKFRGADVFDIPESLRKAANRPGMMPQHALPMLHENDEEKYDKKADSQGWAENLHSTCIQGPL